MHQVCFLLVCLSYVHWQEDRPNFGRTFVVFLHNKLTSPNSPEVSESQKVYNTPIDKSLTFVITSFLSQVYTMLPQAVRFPELADAGVMSSSTTTSKHSNETRRMNHDDEHSCWFGLGGSAGCRSRYMFLYPLCRLVYCVDKWVERLQPPRRIRRYDRRCRDRQICVIWVCIESERQ